MPKLDPATRRRRLIRLLLVASIMLVVFGGVYALYRVNRTVPGVMTDEDRIVLARDAFEEQAFDDVVSLLENPASNDSTIQAIHMNAEMLRIYIAARQEIPLYNDRQLARIITPLKQLIELSPDDAESRYLLLDSLFELNRNDEALRQAERLNEQHPGDPILLRQLSQAQLGKGQFEAALSTLQQSTQIDTLYVQSYAQMLDLIEEYNLPVEPFIEQAITVYEAYSEDPRAMMIRALAFKAEGNGIQARELLKQARLLPPGDESVVPLLTQWLDRSGMYAEATQYLMQHAEQGIETPAGRMAIYRAFESESYEMILDRLTESDPKDANSDLLGMWVSAEQQAGNPERANELLEQLLDRDNVIATTWGVLLQADQQESTRPGQIIDAIVEGLENDENKELQAMARRHPFFMQRLGRAYLDALEPEAAYAAFSIAAANSSSWASPHRALAETLLKLNQPTAALMQARDAQIRDNSDLSRQWLVLAMTRAADPGDSDVVDRVLQEADKLPQGSEEAKQVLPAIVDMLARADRDEAAAQRIQDVLDSDYALPAKLLESLLTLSQRYGLGQDAVIAQAIEQDHGQTPGLTLIQAEALAIQGEIEQGRALIENATPTPPTKSWQTALAEYLTRHQLEDADRYLVDLAEQHTDDLALQLAALKAIDPATHEAFFPEAIQRLRQLAGQASIHWRLQQARVAMQNPDDKAALLAASEELTRALAFTPVHIELRLTGSRCFMMLGEYRQAAERALAAKTIVPDNSRALLLHGMALHRLDRFQEARLDLIPIATNPRVEPDTRIKACIMLHEQGEFDTVRRAVEQLWEDGQANNQALTMLARIYSGAGEFDKADRVCETLIKVPDLETVRYVSTYYHQTGRPQLAEQAISAAKAAGLSEADRMALLAEDAALRSNPDQALKMIEQAAASEGTVHRWADAAQLALSLARPQDAIRLAKRGLEIDPDHAGLKALVAEQARLDPIAEDPALIPLAVSLLNDATYRKQAADALRITQSKGQTEAAALALADLSNQHPRFKYLSELAGDRLLRAGLDKQAYELALSAMGRFQDSAAAARVAALSSYRLEDWTMLLSSANAWGERNPKDRANADLMRAIAMNRLDRHAMAIETIRPNVLAQNKIDPSNELLFETYTHALTMRDQASQAWALLMPYLSTSPSARTIALRRVSEDLSDTQTATQWIKDIAAIISNEASERFAVASAAFLAGQRLKYEPLVKTADESMTRLLSGPRPHPVEWQYALGQIAQNLGDFERAEASYRSVNSALPDNPLVLNNLALVLAEQGGSSLQEAEQLAKRATQLASKDANLLDTLAIIQLRRSRLDEAMKSIEKAIALEQTNPQWRMTQASIYAAMGEEDRAALIRERYAPLLKN